MWLFENKGTKKRQLGGITVSNEVLKNSRLSSDFILGAIEDGVIMAGHDNAIHLINPAASHITGWSAEDAVGTDFHHVMPLVDQKGEPLQSGQHPFAQALATGKPVRDAKAELRSKDGKLTAISIIVSPVLNEASQPTGNVVGVFRDVTTEKEEEERRSDFISTASHEMRTPLAAIEGYLSLATNPKIAQVDTNAKNYIDKAANATKHLGVLFQDLLTSSRAEDGRLSSYPSAVELGEVVAQVVENERFHAKEKNLDLIYQVSAPKDSGGKVIRPLYYSFVDPHRIAEVLQNIIDNAIKYTLNGSITVRLTGNLTVIQIQVSDTGAGIPTEDIPHLFQKFYRVDNSTTRTIGGTGLGLYISRKLVELYNGRIWVESQLNKGSTFFINLPRLTSTQALEMQKNQAATTSPMQQ